MAKVNLPEHIHKEVPRYVGIVLSLLSSILVTISMFTLNLIVATPQNKSGFQSIGFFSACFDGYIHPDDYVSKSYHGCWFIYYPEFKYLWPWLTPPWFIAAQILGVICMIGGHITAVIMLLKEFGVTEPKKRKSDASLLVIELIVFICHCYVCISIGVMSVDRNWLPRPDHNRLGFSFILFTIAGFLSFYTLLAFFARYVILHHQYGFLPPVQPEETEEKVALIEKGPGMQESSRNGDQKSSSIYASHRPKTATMGSTFSAAAASAYNRDPPQRGIQFGSRRNLGSQASLPGSHEERAQQYIPDSAV